MPSIFDVHLPRRTAVRASQERVLYIQRVPYCCTVTAASGSSVNLRASASTSAALVERVLVGASVTVAGYGDSWCHVSYAGKSGWMMRKYLTLTSDTANETDTATADTVSIQLPRTLAEQLLQALYQGAGRG